MALTINTNLLNKLYVSAYLPTFRSHATSFFMVLFFHRKSYVTKFDFVYQQAIMCQSP